MNSETLALYEKRSKDELARMARKQKAWRGDDARTSKEQLAHIVSGESFLGAQANEQCYSFIPARFPGVCAACGSAISQGEQIAYDRKAMKGQRVKHMRCANDAAKHTHREEAEQDATAAAETTVQGVQDKASKVASALADALRGIGTDAEQVRIIVKDELAKDATRNAAAIKADAVKIADAIRAELKAEVRTVQVKLATGETRDVGKQHKQFPELLAAVAADCNVWVAGPAGSGKTTAAENVAKALGLAFSFDGALDTEYKVLGFTDANGRIVSTPFRKAYTEGGLHLFDECDASLAPATLAINAALANGFATFPDGMARRHPDFRCIGAANTWGLGATFDYVGRNKLDAAFLDRFVQVAWEYDEVLEREVSGNSAWAEYVQRVRAKAKAKGLKLVISPRASIYGARLLAAGMTQEQVIGLTMRNKMRPEDWSAIQA